MIADGSEIAEGSEEKPDPRITDRPCTPQKRSRLPPAFIHGHGAAAVAPWKGVAGVHAPARDKKEEGTSLVDGSEGDRRQRGKTINFQN